MVPNRRVLVVLASSLVVIGALIFLPMFLSGFGNQSLSIEVASTLSSHGRNDKTLSATHRRLLSRDTAVAEPDRVIGDKCTNADIVINQGPTGPLPSGIPAFTVEILNVCVSGCDISRIHLNCGMFSSNNLINPKLFKRLRYGDCLVNDGEPLRNGHAIRFQYSNTFPYPLKVTSLHC